MEQQQQPEINNKNMLVRHIAQSIIAESFYKPDLEMQFWWEAQELEEQNALPENITAFDLYQEYLRIYEGE